MIPSQSAKPVANADTRDLHVQTDLAGIYNIFPILLYTGSRTVKDIRIVHAENLSDPTAAWSGGFFVHWRKGQRPEHTEVRFISGIAADTAYKFRLSIDYA